METKIFVGMKFRYDRLCSDNDEQITEITAGTVITKSLTPGKYLIRYSYTEFDSEGYPVHRYNKRDFMKAVERHEIIPYNGGKRF